MDEIVNGLYRLGGVRQPAFLAMGKHRVVQIDAGPTFMGPAYLNDIVELLGKKRQPDYLFFSHWHFDHVGSAPYLLRHFSEMRLGGSKKFVKLLEQERVIETIARLNQGLVKKYDTAKEFVPQDFNYAALNVGRVLKDGDVVDLGGGESIEVISTPGHTWDSLSFFLPRSRTILTGEAVGIIPGDDFWVSPQFLSNYDDYILSIQRIRQKQPKVIVMGHHQVVKEVTEKFFAASLSDCRAFRTMIEQYLKEAQMDQQKVIQRIKDEEYLTLRKGKQPEEAFLLNTRAQVKLIAKNMTD
ncbi:MAG: MBL fold metallo-hydrolase [Thermodesulfobacteriota bacterium]|nr:MBL fold metallo-hydrolase [Thermodesulfobacteriota bacterium]